MRGPSRNLGGDGDVWAEYRLGPRAADRTEDTAVLHQRCGDRDAEKQGFPGHWPWGITKSPM